MKGIGAEEGLIILSRRNRQIISESGFITNQHLSTEALAVNHCYYTFLFTYSPAISSVNPLGKTIFSRTDGPVDFKASADAYSWLFFHVYVIFPLIIFVSLEDVTSVEM